MFNGKYKTLVTMRLVTTAGSVHCYGVNPGTEADMVKVDAEIKRVCAALNAGYVSHTLKLEPARKNLNPMLVMNYSAPNWAELSAAGTPVYREL